VYLLYYMININSGVYLASRRDFYTEKTEILSGWWSLVLPSIDFDSLYSLVLSGTSGASKYL
jgi:hypothetical protein